MTSSGCDFSIFTLPIDQISLGDSESSLSISSIDSPKSFTNDLIPNNIDIDKDQRSEIETEPKKQTNIIKDENNKLSSFITFSVEQNNKNPQTVNENNKLYMNEFLIKNWIYKIRKSIRRTKRKYIRKMTKLENEYYDNKNNIIYNNYYIN